MPIKAIRHTLECYGMSLETSLSGVVSVINQEAGGTCLFLRMAHKPPANQRSLFLLSLFRLRTAFPTLTDSTHSAVFLLIFHPPGLLWPRLVAHLRSCDSCATPTSSRYPIYPHPFLGKLSYQLVVEKHKREATTWDEKLCDSDEKAAAAFGKESARPAKLEDNFELFDRGFQSSVLSFCLQ